MQICHSRYMGIIHVQVIYLVPTDTYLGILKRTPESMECGIME